MKNMQDVKKEYGLVLRWINGGEADGIRQGSYLWLENINTSEKIYIVDNDEVLYKEAYDLVKEVTHNGFRDKSSINCYDNYKRLFSIMDIAPIQTIDSLTNKTIAQLTRDSQLPRSTVDDILKGNTEFKNMSVKNAMRLGKALNMTIDELFGKIYTTRTWKSLERNGIYYEVEMLQTDKDGSIIYANSWSNESEFFETYEEALKEAREIRSETSKDSYDEVVVNEVEFVDDEAVNSSQKDSFKVYGVMDIEQADYLDTLNDESVISAVIYAFRSYIDLETIKEYVSKGYTGIELREAFEKLN